MRQKNFKRVRRVIEDSLFLAKPTFLPSLMDIGAAVAEVRTMPFVSANPSHLYTLPEYAELQVGREGALRALWCGTDGAVAPTGLHGTSCPCDPNQPAYMYSSQTHRCTRCVRGDGLHAWGVHGVEAPMGMRRTFFATLPIPAHAWPRPAAGSMHACVS